MAEIWPVGGSLSPAPLAVTLQYTMRPSDVKVGLAAPERHPDAHWQAHTEPHTTAPCTHTRPVEESPGLGLAAGDGRAEPVGAGVGDGDGVGATAVHRCVVALKYGRVEPYLATQSTATQMRSCPDRVSAALVVGIWGGWVGGFTVAQMGWHSCVTHLHLRCRWVGRRRGWAAAALPMLSSSRARGRQASSACATCCLCIGVETAAGLADTVCAYPPRSGSG